MSHVQTPCLYCKGFGAVSREGAAAGDPLAPCPFCMIVPGASTEERADAPAQATLADQVACVARECAMRRTVYQGLVARGRMQPGQAAHEIACMEAVLETLSEVERGSAHEP